MTRETPLRRVLAINIYHYRKEKGWSSIDLATYADIGTTTLYALENERANPTIELLGRVAKALDVETSALLIERGREK